MLKLVAPSLMPWEQGSQTLNAEDFDIVYLPAGSIYRQVDVYFEVPGRVHVYPITQTDGDFQRVTLVPRK